MSEEVKITFVEASVVNIKEGDVVVVKTKENLSEQILRNIGKQMNGYFPNNKCIVLDNNFDLDIVRKEEM